ncbi:MAG: hypothetical protein ABSH20_28365 [Tepidisphaeraceae bacterium]|jgi:hypothetical protein
MTALDASVQIRSLRVQLDVLEARLRTSQQPEQHTLADLRGIMAGEAQTTAQEIDAVQYRGIPEGKA